MWWSTQKSLKFSFFKHYKKIKVQGGSTESWWMITRLKCKSSARVKIVLKKDCRPDMTRQQAYALLVDCVKEVQKRLIINLPNFSITVIDKWVIRTFSTVMYIVHMSLSHFITFLTAFQSLKGWGCNIFFMDPDPFQLEKIRIRPSIE